MLDLNVLRSTVLHCVQDLHFGYATVEDAAISSLSQMAVAVNLSRLAT